MNTKNIEEVKVQNIGQLLFSISAFVILIWKFGFWAAFAAYLLTASALSKKIDIIYKHDE